MSKESAQIITNIKSKGSHHDKAKHHSMLRQVITIFTLGKFSTSIYFKEKLDHISIPGFIFTILGVIIVTVLSIQTIISVLKRDQWTT